MWLKLQRCVRETLETYDSVKQKNVGTSWFLVIRSHSNPLFIHRLRQRNVCSFIITEVKVPFYSPAKGKGDIVLGFSVPASVCLWFCSKLSKRYLCGPQCYLDIPTKYKICVKCTRADHYIREFCYISQTIYILSVSKYWL